MAINTAMVNITLSLSNGTTKAASRRFVERCIALRQASEVTSTKAGSSIAIPVPPVVSPEALDLLLALDALADAAASAQHQSALSGLLLGLGTGGAATSPASASATAKPSTLMQALSDKLLPTSGVWRVDQLAALLTAADCLGCDVLPDILAVLSSRLAGKTVAQMREVLGLPDDLSATELAQANAALTAGTVLPSSFAKETGAAMASLSPSVLALFLGGLPTEDFVTASMTCSAWAWAALDEAVNGKADERKGFAFLAPVVSHMSEAEGVALYKCILHAESSGNRRPNDAQPFTAATKALVLSNALKRLSTLDILTCEQLTFILATARLSRYNAALPQQATDELCCTGQGHLQVAASKVDEAVKVAVASNASPDLVLAIFIAAFTKIAAAVSQAQLLMDCVADAHGTRHAPIVMPHFCAGTQEAVSTACVSLLSTSKEGSTATIRATIALRIRDAAAAQAWLFEGTPRPAVFQVSCVKQCPIRKRVLAPSQLPMHGDVLSHSPFLLRAVRICAAAHREVPEPVTRLPQMVKNSSEVAAKIITWCENSAPNAQWNPDAWLEMDQGLLFEVILMANALDLRAIVELCCGAVANMIKGKSVEEIRALLAMDNFDDGFTPEERAAVRAENAWAFE